jgi:hypothetical protein
MTGLKIGISLILQYNPCSFNLISLNVCVFGPILLRGGFLA